jgi:hypothetical protein
MAWSHGGKQRSETEREASRLCSTVVVDFLRSRDWTPTAVNSEQHRAKPGMGYPPQEMGSTRQFQAPDRIGTSGIPPILTLTPSIVTGKARNCGEEEKGEAEQNPQAPQASQGPARQAAHGHSANQKKNQHPVYSLASCPPQRWCVTYL